MHEPDHIAADIVEFEEYARSGVEIIKLSRSGLASLQFGYDAIAGKYGYERVYDSDKDEKAAGTVHKDELQSFVLFKKLK